MTRDFVNGVIILTVSGQLENGDHAKFVDLALPASRAIVLFNSPGGSLRAGIEIGKAIRLKGFATAVPNDVVCASACAIAWLGGAPRLMGSRARVGFHAAYTEDNGAKLPTAVGNALVGAYVSQLGFPDRAVEYVTAAPPDSIQWLSVRDALAVGISVTELQEHAAGANSATPSPKRESRPPAASPETDVLQQARAAIDQRDFPRAFELLSPLAASGNAIAESRLADLFENGSGVPRDMGRAIELVKRSAEGGHACSKTHIGDYYESGVLGPRNIQEAVRWWKLGADGGCPWAYLHLGVALKDGAGAAQDKGSAVLYFERAASEGVNEAYAYLASMYRRGDFVAKDLSKAAKYYRNAAMLGHENAQYRLSLMFNSGDGVAKDVREAYVWASISALQGEPEPVKFKNALSKKFSPAELEGLDRIVQRRSIEIQSTDRENVIRIADWFWRLGN